MVAKTTATTVTLKHLAAALAADHEIPKKQAEGMLNDLVGMMVKHLKKGERIRIGGFGILQVRKRAARMGRKARFVQNQWDGLRFASAPPAWGATRPPASRSRSRRARKSRSAPPRNSKKRSRVPSLQLRFAGDLSGEFS